jgi:hypothetical protein
MLEFHRQSAVVRSPLDKERVGRDFDSTDKAIDKLVYELYGLSPEEIRIVEGDWPFPALYVAVLCEASCDMVKCLISYWQI